jgi:hypothetical protein
VLPELVAEAAFAHAEKPGNVGVDRPPQFATGPAPEPDPTTIITKPPVNGSSHCGKTQSVYW